MAGPRTIHKTDVGRNARKTLDAADRMRRRADEMAVRAFGKLFGDTGLSRMNQAEFAAVFRAAERLEREGRHKEAGEGFASLCDRVTDKSIAGRLILRAAQNHLKAGELEEAFHAFRSAVRISPEGKERIALGAAGRLVTFARGAGEETKYFESALAFGFAADMLKGFNAKRASMLYCDGGFAYVVAGSKHALAAKHCFQKAMECTPKGAGQIAEKAVLLFDGMVAEAEEKRMPHDAARILSMAAELNGMVSPELARRYYMRARGLNEAAGDLPGAAEMCSKAADSIAEKEPAKAAKLKVEAGEIRLGLKNGELAGREFASAAKLLEGVDPAAALDLHLRAGDLYAVAKTEDHVDRGPDIRYFKEAKAEYMAATELAKTHAVGKLIEIGVKVGCLIAEAEKAGHTLE